MKPGARRAAAALLLGLTALAAGCFDYEVELVLERDGSGSLEVSLAAPAYLAQGRGPDLDTIIFPPPRRQVRRSDGRVVLVERLAFEWLDVLALRRLHFKVTTEESGVVGFGDYTYRVRAHLEALEGDFPDRDIRPGAELERPRAEAGPSDPAAAKAARLLAGGLAGHHVSVVLRLPGEVSRAWPVGAGTAVVEPEIAGSTVAWRIPLAALAAADVRHSLDLRCEFQGRLDFRGKEQTMVETQAATPAHDEAARRAREDAARPGGEARP
jgi:hypothetical protein